MLVRCGIIMLTAFGLDSGTIIQAAGPKNGVSGSLCPPEIIDGSDAIAATPFTLEQQAIRSTPNGHRQPRPCDIPETVELSPIDRELRREDEKVDKKLIICRGC